ncbi:Glycosyltransferase involved in cell wall bisynthesis [Bryocella elongata]|uniref:Glycosyltransferase involved in cell wall bisynthesis n=1 Tax=Bryocella elongata TaxID=863522 RepID=A0A1H5UMF8_9BACT|nr:glycosyltransferase family 2 protein [Bryocella elongata]SEF75608.1 Glycosyltransferase involved in cell wall bisynthesis [Bryocella elongata]
MSVTAAIAVVIPVYNGENFIGRALDSVFAQTLQPVEIFVIDDGSTDGTLALLTERYAGRVTLIRQANRGPSVARNAGIRAATAEFIAWLDADDWWQPEKLERQAAALHANPTASASYTGLRMYDEDSGKVWNQAAMGQSRVAERLRTCNPSLTPSCLMARRRALVIIGGFNETRHGCEDWVLAKDLADVGPLLPVDEPLTNYRVNSTGLSSKVEIVYRDFEQILEGTLLRGTMGLSRWLWRRRAIAHQAFSASMTARSVKDHVTERRYMLLSLRTWPSPWFESRRFKAAAITFLRSR